MNGLGSIAGDIVPVGGEPTRKQLDGGENGEEAARDYERGSSKRECVCEREKVERQALSNSFFWLVLCVQLSPGCAHMVINHWEFKAILS